MNEALLYDELQIGDRWISLGRTITEADVVNFAGISGDFDPLHMDHHFARQSPFRRPIAHGLLGLSFVAGLGSHAPSVRTLAFVAIRSWEFHKPAHIGDTVYVITEVVEKESAGRRAGKVAWKRQLCNQDGLVIQSGIFETLVSAGPARGTRHAKTAHSQAPPLAPHRLPRETT